MSTADLLWRKSSRSNGQGNECVEVARWRKSSHSNAQGNECVEVALVATLAAIRDSKNPDGGVLMISETAWDRFRSAIR